MLRGSVRLCNADPGWPSDASGVGHVADAAARGNGRTTGQGSGKNVSLVAGGAEEHRLAVLLRGTGTARRSRGAQGQARAKSYSRE